MALLQYKGAEGEKIWIEIDEPARRGDDSELETPQTKAKFEDAVVTAKPAIEAFRKLVASLPDKPDAVELTFGLKASAEVGGFLVFAKAGGEATFGLKLSWKKGGA
jgi:hypothetical protein